MNTQSHLLLASAVLGRSATPKEQWWILGGAFAPDLSIFIFAVFGFVSGMSGEQMWGEAYWSEPWQTLSAISNSFPLWAAGLGACALRRSRVGMLFCAAALIHLCFDLPLHHDDAHKHFWPITDWRFESPLSYWDRDHHGRWVGLVEAVGGLALCGLLWRRHRAKLPRLGIALCGLAYLLVPMFWILSLSSG